MGNLQIFNNEELSLKIRTIQNEDGGISINAEDTAIGFGWYQKQNKNNKVYTSIRWETLNQFCDEFSFPNKLGKDDYIPEALFYLLGMKANNEAAQKFQKWLAIDVIPSIRKTGSYAEAAALKNSKDKDMKVIALLHSELGELIAATTQIENRVVSLEDTMTIDYAQQLDISKLAKQKAVDSMGGKENASYRDSSLRGRVFSAVWKDYKEYFLVNSYKNTAVKDYQKAKDYLNTWKAQGKIQREIEESNLARI